MKNEWLRAKPGADRGQNDPSQEIGKLNAAFKFKRNFSYEHKYSSSYICLTGG